MTLAYAHGGVDHSAPAALGTLLAEWSFDPVVLVSLALALLYFRGYARYRLRGGRRFPWWRPALFALGQAAIVLALMSPIDALAGVSFTWHMVQHDLLMLVAVPLLLLGAPFIPVIRGIPLELRRHLFIPFARLRPVRWAATTGTRPLVAFVLFESAVLAWHLPGFYDAALFNERIHLLMHGMFVFTGLLFWWNLLTPYPFPSRLHALLRCLLLFASSVVTGALSALIVFSDDVLYGYVHQPGFWGLTMHVDQEIGSGLMWVMGGMIRLAWITGIFIRFAYQENAKEPYMQTAPIQGRGVPQGA